MLEVTDVSASVAFYVDQLGFTCGNTMDAEPGRLLWASLSRDGVGLMVNLLHTHDDDEGDDHGHDHPSAPVLTGSLYINVDDVDALAADLAHRVTIEFGPADQPHGMREFGVVDPDGYFLVFGRPIDG